MKIIWTKLDAAINRAAREHYEESQEFNRRFEGITPYPYGEHIGIFEDGVRWAMRHYRMLGFRKVMEEKI